MSTAFILLAAAIIFGICFLVDKAFSKAFRSKAQHRSGLAVRATKRYGVFGVVFTAIGIMGIVTSGFSDRVLLIGSVIVAVMGIGLAVYYLSFGIFYNGDTFLVSSPGKPSREYRFADILGQKLYMVQGGNIIVELHMADGTAVSLHSNMEGIYPFLDTAFAAWCLQTGRDPQSCDFHDPSQSLWFPTVEDI